MPGIWLSFQCARWGRGGLRGEVSPRTWRNFTTCGTAGAVEEIGMWVPIPPASPVTVVSLTSRTWHFLYGVFVRLVGWEARTVTGDGWGGVAGVARSSSVSGCRKTRCQGLSAGSRGWSRPDPGKLVSCASAATVVSLTSRTWHFLYGVSCGWWEVRTVSDSHGAGETDEASEGEVSIHRCHVHRVRGETSPLLGPVVRHPRAERSARPPNAGAEGARLTGRGSCGTRQAARRGPEDVRHGRSAL